MKRWMYAGDPLCVIACLCYLVNRLLVPAAFKTGFLRDHFNDLWFIPAALPPMLWLYRRLGLRENDLRPRWSEVVWHLAIWSVAAEVVGPRLFHRAVGDPWDVVAYAAGAMASGVVWSFA